MKLRTREMLSTILAVGLLLGAYGCSANKNSVDDSVPIEQEKALPLAADYILLQSDKEQAPHTILEQGACFLCYYDDGSIESFSITDGNLLYKTDDCGLCEKSSFLRCEAYDGKIGYDYRLCYDDCILYRSSTDPQKQLIQLLPHGIAVDYERAFDTRNFYDMNEEYYIYATEDGFHRSALDGSGDVLLLANDDLPALGEYLTANGRKIDSDTVTEYSYRISYQNPSFICEGAKIVASIFSKELGLTAAITCDLATGTVESTILWYDPWYAIYPLQDQYIAVRGSTRVELLDAATGEPRIYQNQTDTMAYIILQAEPFLVLSIQTPDIEDNTHLRAYLCPGFISEEQPLAAVTDEETLAWVCGATKHYAFIALAQDWMGEKQICAVRYA